MVVPKLLATLTSGVTLTIVGGISISKNGCFTLIIVRSVSAVVAPDVTETEYLPGGAGGVRGTMKLVANCPFRTIVWPLALTTGVNGVAPGSVIWAVNVPSAKPRPEIEMDPPA